MMLFLLVACFFMFAYVVFIRSDVRWALLAKGVELWVIRLWTCLDAMINQDDSLINGIIAISFGID